jgi:hypothetical protein
VTCRFKVARMALALSVMAMVARVVSTARATIVSSYEGVVWDIRHGS